MFFGRFFRESREKTLNYQRSKDHSRSLYSEGTPTETRRKIQSLITIPPADCTLFINNISVVNVYRHLKENTSWFNTKRGEPRMETLMNRIKKPIEITTIQPFPPKPAWALTMSVIVWIVFVLVSVMLLRIFLYKRQHI